VTQVAIRANIERRPRLLDLFCGAGGCSVGYHRAGFDVVGVDIKPQPNYPYEFHQADAIEYLSLLVGSDNGQPATWDAIHASPPCQHFSAMTSVTGNRDDHPDLIEPVRRLLRQWDHQWGVPPYVIENVERAGRALINPIRICGTAMGLTIDGNRFRLARHRLFECSFPVMVAPCACASGAGEVLGVYGGGARQDTRKEANPRGGNTSKANKAQAAELMGIDWMTRAELTQAIPPAYCEHVGGYLLAEVRRRERLVA
jgi:DNA (cytosine-5)-methyltransferase 1